MVLHFFASAKKDHRHIDLRFLFIENEDFYSPIPILREFDQSAADAHIHRILSRINHRILMHIHRENVLFLFLELLFIDFTCTSMQFLTSSQGR